MAFVFRYFAVFLLLLGVSLPGCYSFKGISIDPNIKTFFVLNFENTAVNAPPTLAVDFTERLKDKVRTETPLKLNSDAPDAEFSGRITDFRVVPVAPKPGETVSLNRLEIRMQVNYTVTLEQVEGSWPNERTFSHFAEFGNDRDLLSVQDELIRQIADQLLEDIFNAAFNNW
ncbi:MAG: LptE family protein [Lewinellaceae bacterium]|nr:LptE family protein [Lewinellaceae bacterium]